MHCLISLLPQGGRLPGMHLLPMQMLQQVPCCTFVFESWNTWLDNGANLSCFMHGELSCACWS